MRLLFLYRELEFHNSLEEAKYLDYPTSFPDKKFTVQLLFLGMEMEFRYILEEREKAYSAGVIYVHGD